MAQTVLTQLLNEIKILPVEDLRELERVVHALLNSSPLEAEQEAALRVLQESGLVKQIKRPLLSPQPEQPPIPILGKPLSETLVEERR